MAALYLHNAIFVPDMPDSFRGHSPHSRTISSGTLRTIGTTYSQPTEPLLDSSTLPGHTVRHSSDGDLAALERKGFWEQTIRRRRRRLKVAQSILEFIMAAWAVYNTVRYFLAYTVYHSSKGQSVTLVLGTLTALAFFFSSCAAVISLLERRLVFQHIPIRLVLIMSTAFRLLASFFLIVPAIVNLVLTILWRTSPDPDLSFRRHVDIDIVWSIVPHSCSGNPVGLGFYLGAAIIRILITSLIIVAHYALSSAYRATRRPTSRRRHSHQSHHRHHRPRSSVTHSLSGATLVSSASTPPMTSSSTLPVSVPPPRAPNPTLRHTSDRQFSSGAHSPFEASDEEGERSVSTDTDGQNPLVSTSASVPRANDRELQTFVNRFRTLVSQISRETEDALAYALPTPDAIGDIYTSLPPTPRRALVHSRDTNTIDLESGPLPDLEPTPVRILNTFVRRMPTIESLGSREQELSVSVRTDSSRGSLALSHQHYSPTSMSSSLGSRPDTRHGSEGGLPPSRHSSLGPAAGARVVEEKMLESGAPTSTLFKKQSNSLRSSRSSTAASVNGGKQRNGSGNTTTSSLHSSASTSFHSFTESPTKTSESPFAFDVGEGPEGERLSPSSSLEGEIDHVHSSSV